MKKLWETVKNNSEITGYVILAVLIFCACFSPYFIWVASIYALVFAIYMRNEIKIIGLILFVYCFYNLFSICDLTFNINGKFLFLNLGQTLLNILEFLVVVLYFQRVFKQEIKINFKVFIPLVLFFIYCSLPINQYHWYDIFYLILIYLVFYVAFQERKNFDFVALARIFITGIILSFVFGLYVSVSPLLADNLFVYTADNGGLRYQGLTQHPLQLAAFAMLAVSILLILIYQKKISLPEFYILFIAVYFLGYLTISRAFLVCVAVALVLFAIFYFKQQRSKAWKLLIPILMIIVFVAVFCLDYTKSYFYRFLVEEHESLYSDDFSFSNLYEGYAYLYNRKDIYKVYFLDWLSSPKTIFFGRGTKGNLPWNFIFGVDAHNLCLQELWEHGLVGYAFYIILICCSINWKKIKNFKKYLISLILILPFLFFTSVEIMYYEFSGMILVLALFGALEQISTEKTTKVATLNLQGENVTLNQICDEKKQDSNLIKKIKLSIIIPVYNSEKFIQRCLDKVLQIELKKEVIVINDGSNDESLSLLQAYGKKITLINLEQNQGVSHARNVGLENASGDYIAFLDIDDDFELDMHLKILSQMLREDADVGICRCDILKPNKELIKFEKPFNFTVLPQNEVIKNYLLNKFIHTVWTSVYKSSLIKDIKFEENVCLGEDRLFQLQVLLKSQKTCFVDEILYHYIKNDFSASHNVINLDYVKGYTQIPAGLTKDEVEVLENQYADEFSYFKLCGTVVAVNMLSRWILKNKGQKQQGKELLKKIVTKEKCKAIMNHKYSRPYAKIEFFVLKTFGFGFHLFMFPIYNWIRDFLRIFDKGL